MKHRHSRILATQVGNLARPPEVVQGLSRKPDCAPFSDDQLAVIRRHVAEAVQMRAVCTGAIAYPGDEAHNRSCIHSCVCSSGASIS